MSSRMDVATASFLDAAADDLQRQAGRAGIVEGITTETVGDVVTLIASIRVGVHVFEARGSADSQLTAYASLTRVLPEVMLASAFRAMLAS